MAEADTTPVILHTTAKGGSRCEFLVEHEVEKRTEGVEWRFRVYCPPLRDSAWYEAAFIEHPGRRLRVTMLDNASRAEYAGKGIAEALFAFVQQLLQRQVVSSSNRAGDAEWRTCPATKVWKRIVGAGNAVYDEIEDRFSMKFEPSN